MDFSALVARQRAYFESGATRGADFRLSALKSLREALVKNEALIFSALKADLNKAPMESYMCENGLVLEEIRFHIKHLRRWMKERRVPTPLAQFHARSFVSPEPYGVALILSPWNYPIQLCLSPLVGAISAGNCAVVKPSAYAPATSAAIAKVLGEAFPPGIHRRGRRRPRPEQRPAGTEVRLHLLHRLRRRRQGGDGGRRQTPHPRDAGTGRQKPGHRRCNGEYPARRPPHCLWQGTERRSDLRGAGLSPHPQVRPAALCRGVPRRPQGVFPHRRLCEHAHHHLRKALPPPPRPAGESDHRPRRRHDDARRFIEPTLLADVSPDSPHQQEEIFGPILPMLPYETLDEVISFVRAAPARWLFTSSRPIGKRSENCWTVAPSAAAASTIPSSTSPPRTCPSRRGRFRHGQLPRQKSFDTFTHERSIVKKSTWLDLPMRYHPYGEGKLKLIRKFMT